jgi:hypothetical protein
VLLLRLRAALRQGRNPADLVETLASALPVADRLGLHPTDNRLVCRRKVTGLCNPTVGYRESPHLECYVFVCEFPLFAQRSDVGPREQPAAWVQGVHTQQCMSAADISCTGSVHAD